MSHGAIPGSITGAGRPIWLPGSRIWYERGMSTFLPRAALACLIAGIGLLTVAETAWAHALGVVGLLGFVALGFPAALPPDVYPLTNHPRR